MKKGTNIISSRLLLSAFFLLGMMSLHAQESVMDAEDFEKFSRYTQESNVDSTIYYAEKLLNTYDKNNWEKDSTFCYITLVLGRCYSANGHPETSISLLSGMLPTIMAVLGKNNSLYATLLSDLSSCYSELGNYSEGIRLETEALEIIKKCLGPEHTDYAYSLHNLASSYSGLGNYSEAVRLETEVMEIYKKSYGPEHPDYATSLNSLANYNKSIGNYSEAMRLGTEALNIRKKVLGSEHLDYAWSLGLLSGCNSNLGNYYEAVKMETEAMGIIKNTLGLEHPTYATSLSNLAGYYSHLGNYSEAIHMGTEALEIRKKVLGTEHIDYANSLHNLARYYSNLGNYPETIRLETEALEIIKKCLGPEHPNYATSLSNLANYYSDIGNYPEAIRLETEALEIRKKVLGSEHPAYAISLNNLASYYKSLGNYSEAIRLGTEALEIRKKVLGSEHPAYATSLSNLASYYKSIGNCSEAIHMGTEALEIRKKVLGTEHIDYANSLHNLARYSSELGNYSEGIRLEAEALEIIKRCLGPEHPNYATSLGNLAGYYSGLGNYSESYALMMQSLDNSQRYVLNSFSELSSRLRETLWNDNYSFLFNKFFPSAVFRYQKGSSVSELYDKTALFAKGILLNSSIGMRQLILESGDTTLIDRYDALLSNISIYDKQLEKPIAERMVELDSLRTVIQRQEMEIARDSKAYGDFARNMRISWQDVQKNLSGQDIAIEFLEIPLWFTDSTMYVALTLKKDYDMPRMTTLFEKRRLEAIPENIYYTRSALYDLIWKPLEAELSGVKDVYFSPSGELHCIGIEYIPVNAEENVCDRYSMHRLSSTRQLAFIDDETNGEEAILYGGLKYDMVADNAIDNPQRSVMREKKDRGLVFKKHVNVDSLSLRGTYEYLPGTKQEGDKIKARLHKSSIPYTYYYGHSGTEETFKELNGTKPRILHIATHGFYLSQQDAVRNNFVRSMSLDGQQSNQEDKAMTRSGLLLSHCKPALDHKTVGEDIEDGILTAQEISKLDLRGLDLVVLSACQTGLGDIISGEGVFGLQRGFKNAGARTILMSLWKVSDSATQRMMSSFYDYYLKGMSKEQAFRLAREKLRNNTMPGQKKPDWAAFVMLDGIK